MCKLDELIKKYENNSIEFEEIRALIDLLIQENKNISKITRQDLLEKNKGIPVCETNGKRYGLLKINQEINSVYHHQKEHCLSSDEAVNRLLIQERRCRYLSGLANCFNSSML